MSFFFFNLPPNLKKKQKQKKKQNKTKQKQNINYKSFPY